MDYAREDKQTFAVAEFFSGAYDSEQLKKITKHALPILMVVGFAIGCIAPFWFSGGWVKNGTVRHNTAGLTMPGWRWGSSYIYAREGQTIEVDVEVHEIKKGGMWVSIMCEGMIDVKSDESTNMHLTHTGKRKLRLVTKRSGFYHIKFSHSGQFESRLDALTGGKAHVKYSASWDAK